VTQTVERKRVLIPTKGMYLTDGNQLVEVLGKIREGYRAVDVLTPVEDCDDVALIVLSPSDVNGGVWRLVVPD
jgi:hypothetical protein